MVPLDRDSVETGKRNAFLPVRRQLPVDREKISFDGDCGLRGGCEMRGMVVDDDLFAWRLTPGASGRTRILDRARCKRDRQGAAQAQRERLVRRGSSW